MTQDYHAWLWEMTGRRCLENLQKHGFDAHLAKDIETAKVLCLHLAKSFETFGFGGSVTTREMGIHHALREMGKKLYDHWEPDKEMDDMTIRLAQGRCDCFFCSANAISSTGEIVNVDGIGNRTNAMTFGCKKVIIVAGMNKVTTDLESALRRVREKAGPMRAKSLNMETPCAKTGACGDCNSPQRICRITTILHRKPLMTDVSIVLVQASLGF